MKHHKNEGKLLTIKPVENDYDIDALGLKGLWIFMGLEKINDRDCWCFLHSTKGKGFNVPHEPHRSLKNIFKSNGYEIEFVS